MTTNEIYHNNYSQWVVSSLKTKHHSGICDNSAR